MRDVIVAAYFTKRLSAAPRTTVRTNRRSAVCAFRDSRVAARRTYVAITVFMLNLTVDVASATYEHDTKSKQSTY